MDSPPSRPDDTTRPVSPWAFSFSAAASGESPCGAACTRRRRRLWPWLPETRSATCRRAGRCPAPASWRGSSAGRGRIPPQARWRTPAPRGCPTPWWPRRTPARTRTRRGAERLGAVRAHEDRHDGDGHQGAQHGADGLADPLRLGAGAQHVAGRGSRSSRRRPARTPRPRCPRREKLHLRHAGYGHGQKHDEAEYLHGVDARLADALRAHGRGDEGEQHHDDGRDGAQLQAEADDERDGATASAASPAVRRKLPMRSRPSLAPLRAHPWCLRR